METFEEPQKSMEEFKEKKKKVDLQLPRDTAERIEKYITRYLSDEPLSRYFGGSADLRALAVDYNPNVKYNKLIKRVLREIFEAKSFPELGHTFGAIPSEEERQCLRKHFDDFFSPLTQKEKLEKKLEEYNQEKKELVPKLERIQQNPMLSKDERKREEAPIGMRLLELSRLRKPLEEKLKLFDALFEFIPGYRADLTKLEWQLEELISRMHKVEKQPEEVEKFVVPPPLKDFVDMKEAASVLRNSVRFGGWARDVFSIEQLTEDFQKKWLKEKLDKSLEKLYKDLEKMT